MVDFSLFSQFMKKRITYGYAILFLFAILISFDGAGQASVYRIEAFNPPDNISINTMRCSVIDKKGFLWFGIDNGLVRYDGSDLRTYEYKPNDTTSLGATIINSLGVYGDSLVIGFRGGGIDIFDMVEERFHHFRVDHHSDLPSNFVKNIVVDDHKNIWVTFQQNSDLYQFEIKGSELKLKKSITLNSIGVFQAIQFRDGILLATAGKGLLYYNLLSEKVESYNTSNGRLTSGMVNKIIQQDNSVIWAATDKAIEKLEFENNTFLHKNTYKLPEESVTINALAIDPNHPNYLWIGTLEGGIYSLNFETDKLMKINSYESESSRGLNVQTMMFDHSDILWIGTLDNGIYKINVRNSQFYAWPDLELYDSAIGNKSITSILEDSHGLIWVGTETQGLIQLDFKHHRSIAYMTKDREGKLVDQNNIRSIVELDNGEIWYGTYGAGVFRITNIHDPNAKKQVEIPGLGSSLIRHIVLDHQKKLWIGTRDGLICYDIQSRQSTIYAIENGLSSNRIRHLHLDGDIVWIGTDEGLNVLNRISGEIKILRHDPGNAQTLSNDQIRSILIDSSERVWVGTLGGLNLLDKADSTFTHFDEFIQYNVNAIFGICQDREYLWLSTNNGILRFNTSDGHILQFTEDDGLQSNRFEYNNYFKSSAGKIYFGGAKGLNAFIPETIARNENVPPVYITGVMVNQDLTDFYPNDELKEVNLTFKEKNLTFIFSALDYALPAKNQYRYLLENYDEDWQYTIQDNKARYTNLSPGEYTFRVTGSNNHGIWNERGDAIRITIFPPWWNTNLARAGYIFIFVLSLIGAHLALTAQKTKTNKKLTHLVDEKTQELKLANLELSRLNDEIHAQNEQLKSNVEEISTQRDDLEAKNRTLLELKASLDESHQKLLTINETLESKVKKRTIHLEKANAELDRFVYSASHDLSAPLKSIRGLLHLDHIDKDTDHNTYRSLILESIDKLETVIHSLLQFSRNTNSSEVFENILVYDFIGAIINELKFLHPGYGITVLIHGDKDEKWYTDAYRFRLAFSNVLSNAFKYIDKDKEKREIHIEYAELKHQYTMTIKDNGIGIAQDQLDKIFDMFYRATEMSTGSGLGLYIVKEALNKIGGEINVSSEVGLGTQIKLILPKKH